MINRSNYLQHFFKLLITTSLFLSIIIFSVKITLNFRQLYYFDIKYLNIEKYTHLNNAQIKSTYDYLIHYVNSKEPLQFQIPLLPSSRDAIIHFEEVKNLFFMLNNLLFICSVIIIFGIYFMKKHKDFSPLKWCSIFLLLSCLFVMTTFFISFDKTFDIFHEMFFHNNYWIFDPKTDPIITILPQEFFLHCSIFTLFLILCWSTLLLIIYRRLKYHINST